MLFVSLLVLPPATRRTVLPSCTVDALNPKDAKENARKLVAAGVSYLLQC